MIRERRVETTAPLSAASERHELEQSIVATADGTSSTSNYTFDDAGRLLLSQTGGANANTTSEQHRYDAENHNVGITYATTSIRDGSSAAQSTSYVWGTNGHPALIGSSMPESVPSGNLDHVTTTNPISYETLHWDGSALLFTTNAQGQLDDIKIGTSGDITPLDPMYKGLTIYDRDPSGTVTYCHNATATGGTGPSSAIHSRIGRVTFFPGCTLTASIAWNGGAQPPLLLTAGYGGGVGLGRLVGMPRTDGITDKYSTIQGVRTYDPQLGSWTSPDAYAGTVHDPMSQQSYMYNNNNPVSYSDPSGYCAITMPVPCADALLTGIFRGLGTVMGDVAGAAVAPITIVLMNPAPGGMDDLVSDKETRGTDKDELKANDIDAHEVKHDTLGKKADVSKYDLRVNKKTGELIIFKKGAKQGQHTGVHIKTKTKGSH